MSPPVIVTRAQPGADETVARLQSEGFSPILSPALILKPVTPPPSLPQNLDHLIFTSANGVRFYASATTNRNAQAWCVGDATATEARAAGFTQVHNAKGDSDDLAAHILTAASSPADTWLHVANTAAAGNLVATLKSAGLNIAFLPLYETGSSQVISLEAKGLLSAHASKIILIHSAKGAKGFLQLASGFDLSTATIAAISPNAAAPFQGIPTGPIIRAARPNEDALMQAVHIAAQNL